MNEDDKLQSIRNYSRTTVLEREEAPQEHKDTLPELNLFSSSALNQPIPAPKKETQTVQQTTPALEQEVSDKAKRENEVLEKLKQKIEQERLENAQKLELERQKMEQEQQAQQEEAQEKLDEEQIEEQVESLYNTSLSIEASGEENAELSEAANQKSKGYKFRFRLMTGVFVCIIAILSGWIIGNAVQIAETSSQIATEVAQGEEYNVNIAKYLQKISSLDGKVKETPPNAEDGNLLPIEEVIPITPQPVSEPTEYEQQSNWFDKICNWFRNLFGG